MDIDKMRSLLDELAAFMKENDLAELEVDTGGVKAKLRKVGAQVQPQIVHPAPAVSPAPAAPTAPAADPGPAPAQEQPGTVTIRSPMVGTYYRSPKPESDHFAEVGDEVEEDSILCIIEAMKVMNEIKAEHKGHIVTILVENGEPVEYGQPLFVIATQ